jgi:hypothetical protein
MKGAVEKDVARAASETSTCTTAAQIEFWIYEDFVENRNSFFDFD